MKPKSKPFLRHAIAPAIWLLTLGLAHAVGPYYWDKNGAAAGSGVTNGGSYTWNNQPTANQWVDSTNTAVNPSFAVWNAPVDVDFVSTGDAAGKSYTVTTSGGNMYLGALTVNSGNLTIDLKNNPNFMVGAAGKTWTVNDGSSLVIKKGSTSIVSLNGNTLTMDVQGAATASVEGFGGTGTNSKLTKIGTGTLTINGGSSYAGATTISGGTLALSGSGTLGSGALSLLTGGKLDLGTTTQTLGGNLNAGGAGNGAVGSIINGTIAMNGKAVYLQNGTFTMNLTGSGNSRLWIGGDAAATVELGGTNSSTYSDNNSTIIGHSTTGTAGTVKLLSATALGPSGQTTQVHSGTLDLNGQTGVTVSQIALSNTSHLLNNNTGTAASFGGTVDFTGATTHNIGGAGDITLSGVLQSGGFTKTGAGTLTLTFNNSYSGETRVEGGTLLVNGEHTGTGIITVSAATFGGSGQVGDVEIGSAGILAPGATARDDNSLRVRALSLLDPGARLDFELGAPGVAGAALPENDLVTALSMEYSFGQVNVLEQPGFATAAIDSKWPLIKLTSGTVPTDHKLTLNPALDGRYALQVADNNTTLYLVAVPGAGTAGLMVLAALILSLRRSIHRFGPDH